MIKLFSTAERVSQEDASDNYVFQRSLLAYIEAGRLVHGRVLEIGTGNGYGIEYIAQNAQRFITLDKHRPASVSNDTLIHSENVQFLKMKVPPFDGIPDNHFDFVITFQVIEHVHNDVFFVEEIYRVLKPGGQLIVTTPNKPMSITRNPWHIREYTIDELEALLLPTFEKIEKNGVFGSPTVASYYEKNKASVARITRFDLLNLQYRLPGWMLQIPYDILNRVNRKRLLRENRMLTKQITLDDYYLAPADSRCYDLFFIATKHSV